MSAYEIPVLKFSAVSAAAVARRRFVKINGSEAGLQTGAGEKAVGVSFNDPSGAGQVLEMGTGIVIVEAGAAVAAGVEVESDANGKAILKSTGISNGYTLTAAGAAGELISVKLS